MNEPQEHDEDLAMAKKIKEPAVVGELHPPAPAPHDVERGRRKGKTLGERLMKLEPYERVIVARRVGIGREEELTDEEFEAARAWAMGLGLSKYNL